MAIGLVLMPLLRADAGQAQESAPSQFGFVVDESGGAVAGALLTVRTAHGAPRQNTATAGDGSFAFRGLPPGSYWLEVTAHPFQQQRLRLELDGTEVEPLRIVLGLAPFQSEVTVTAERGTMTDVDGAAGHSRRPLWPHRRDGGTDSRSRAADRCHSAVRTFYIPAGAGRPADGCSFEQTD